jgi:hypothetical protein
MEGIKNVVGKHEGNNYSKDLGVYGKLMLTWILPEQNRDGVEWICLSQVMVLWPSVVNATIDN